MTKNSFDFRGPAEAPGVPGLLSLVDLHAGLVCLNGPVGMDIDLQTELFDLALDDLDARPDMVNQVLEITLKNSRDDDIRIVRYALPQE